MSRKLAHIEKIVSINEIPNYDRVVLAEVLGWHVIVQKDTFKPGDLCVYVEIDSVVPKDNPDFAFLEKKKYRIRTIKMCGTISQGICFPLSILKDKCRIDVLKEGEDVTEALGIKQYEETMDNDKEVAAVQIKNHWPRFLMRYRWFRKLVLPKKQSKGFPTHLEYVHKTDQERCENMPWILKDKTPFVKTQKCDGSSGTYILERKSFGRFEFYVCSRNIRQFSPKQKTFYDNNYYWEVAIKYNIQDKLKDFLKKNPNLSYVCWQGEICSPKIQGNPHGLKETHLYCFHMIDSEKGQWDIRDAKKVWDSYNMETVPIICDDYILPDTIEELKDDADVNYVPSVCEGKTNLPAEGYVYYKTTEPAISFKNVSRKYLLKHNI